MRWKSTTLKSTIENEMKSTLAFDVYGTLIDTSGVFETVQEFMGDEAPAFMEKWRSTQLEYSFRRGLMNAYVDFSVVTREALDHCCSLFNKTLNTAEIQRLMNAYKVLPAFADVETALTDLSETGYRKYAFSNGSENAVATLLENAHIHTMFDGIVSVERTKMFKPSPKVYRHFTETTQSKKEATFLISGNPFDIIGALHYGMKGIWVKRSEKVVFDPWGLQPTAVIQDLTELKSVL